jgi:hypothetical protein
VFLFSHERTRKIRCFGLCDHCAPSWLISIFSCRCNNTQNTDELRASCVFLRRYHFLRSKFSGRQSSSNRDKRWSAGTGETLQNVERCSAPFMHTAQRAMLRQSDSGGEAGGGFGLEEGLPLRCPTFVEPSSPAARFDFVAPNYWLIHLFPDSKFHGLTCFQQLSLFAVPPHY